MKNAIKLLSILFLTGGLVSVVHAQIISSNPTRLSIPAENWVLSVNLKGFNIEKDNSDSKANTRYMLATQKNTGITISVFIEKAAHKGDYDDCRSFYWEKASKSPLPMENITLYEESNIAFVEYDVVNFQGQRIDFHSLNAYLSYGDYWIDVHISKTQYKEKEKALFDDIVKSLEIDKKTVNEIFVFASIAFMAGNYHNAIIGYEQILETEKEKVSIDRTIWRVIVDNLGMSYGIIGDLNNAKRVFEYGIRLDSEYPLFYYNLACAYAESSDLDNTLVNLEQAFKRKTNMIKGEKFPNPHKDDSFKKYLKNEQFKQLLKKYKM